MKRIVILLLIFTCQTVALSAHDGFQGLTQKNVFIHDNIPTKNGHFVDEYEMGTFEDMEHLDDMEDYEQHICDTAEQPKISSIQARLIAMFDSIIGSLLVKMIVIKEVSRHYFGQVKQVIAHWLESLNKNKNKIIK